MIMPDPNPFSPKTPSPSSSYQHDQRAPSSFHIGRGTVVGWFRSLVFVLLDIALISASWKTAQTIVLNVTWLQSVNTFQLLGETFNQPGFLIPILLITVATLASAGLYSQRESRRRFSRLVQGLILAQGILLVLAFLYEPGLVLSRSTFVLAGFFNIIFVVIGRLLAETFITTLRQKGTISRPIYLIGTPRDRLIAQIALKLISNKEFRIIGQLDLSQKYARDRWTQIVQEIADQGVGEVFVCSWQSIDDPMALYWSLKTAGIHLRILPIGLEVPHQSPKIEMIGGLLTIQFQPPALIGGDFWTKRIFDLVVASGLLLVLSPILITIGILIKLDSPGPIFFKQTRMGLRGRHIKVWKFRTMVMNADRLLKELEAKNEIKGGVLFKMKNDPRITKVGGVLRRYSLDELPQLINVLIGEMSLVGPRPLPLRDVEGFAPHHFVRHNVLPGITGLWQVSGRSDINDFEYAFRLDMAYIQNWSLALDFQILMKTVQVVLGSKGAY
jgi:exopolysaccharide biosynthesis polyprenyl glycosylphosphotransferase